MNPNQNPAPLAPTPQPQQPTMPPSPQAPPPYATQPANSDAGKTLGILSVVLFWLGLIATVIGVVGLRQSKRAGRTNAPAIVGIILSISISILLVIPAILFYADSSFRASVCNQDPTNGLCKTSSTPSTTSGHYSYGSITKTTSFSSGSFTDLIGATSKFFAVITSGSQVPGNVRQNITIKTSTAAIPVSMVMYGIDGNYNLSGRFSEFSPDGSSLMCMTDYQKNVSFMINFDPQNGDGNTATIYLYDETNCTSSNKSMHGTAYGDVKVTTNDVTAGDDDPQAMKSVASGVAQQIANSGMVTNIRAHFIDSFGG